MITTEMNMFGTIIERINHISSGNLERKIGMILNLLNIPKHLKGYKYLKESILLAIEMPESVELVTKIIYPVVASNNNITPGGVERDIRRAVRNVDRADDFKKIMFLGVSKEHYTNKEFIISIVEYISYDGLY